MSFRERKAWKVLAMASLPLALAVAPVIPANAQSILRGTTDEDPIARIGRTAGEPERNLVTRPRAGDASRPSIGQIRSGNRSGSSGASRQTRPASADDPATATQPFAGDATATRLTSPDGRPVRPARPRQQNFRSLEPRPNTAVRNPPQDISVNPGLPPPPPLRRTARPVTDPYAPLGLRMGTFTVFPTWDTSIGYDSNPERRSSGQAKKGSLVIRNEAGLAARSDWSRHELSGELRGGYSYYPTVRDANRPDLTARVGGRIDYTKDTAFDGELRARIDTQSPGSANLSATATGRPLTFQTGASAGVTQRFNRLAVSLRGSIDRSDFEDASLSNGQKLSQKDRNFTQYGLRLRTGYEVTPGIIPFAEALIDTRRYDNSRDSLGFQRDSNGMQLRVGTTVEITRTLTGEVLAGYGLRRFEDQRLRDLRGPVVEAALNWTVSPLTTVRLRGTTEFEETTLTGSSGSVTRRLSLDLSHAFLRNLVFNAGGSFGRADYNGVNRRDDTLRATLGVDYSLTRNLVLRASYANERTLSNSPGNSISSNIYLFGARLQY